MWSFNSWKFTQTLLGEGASAYCYLQHLAIVTEEAISLSHCQQMALEVCVKAAVGAPDLLGDCRFCFSFLMWIYLWVWFGKHFETFYVRLMFFRPILPKGSANVGAEKSSLQGTPHRHQWQTQMVKDWFLCVPIGAIDG